jgi:hypothetical protein
MEWGKRFEREWRRYDRIREGREVDQRNVEGERGVKEAKMNLKDDHERVLGRVG